MFIVIFFIFFASTAQAAISYKLIAPDTVFKTGDNVQFTIEINTNGETITTAQVGMTYDKNYLQYVSATPGNTVDSVTVAENTSGILTISGNKTGGYSGSGTFALITFKIIATGAGSTELCTLVPITTPTPTPLPNYPTATRAPLITSGVNSGSVISFLGISLVTVALSIFIINKIIFGKK
jgi:hypothetical protein